MADPTNFLTTMAALSTAVQTFVDHVIKRRWKWLDTATPADPVNEGRRQSAVHLLSFVVGGVVAFIVGLNPLASLGLAYAGSSLANAVVAGVLVSFGSSFFNEALDAVRAFKKAQEGVRQAQLSQGVAVRQFTL